MKRKSPRRKPWQAVVNSNLGSGSRGANLESQQVTWPGSRLSCPLGADTETGVRPHVAGLSGHEVRTLRTGANLVFEPGPRRPPRVAPPQQFCARKDPKNCRTGGRIVYIVGLVSRWNLEVMLAEDFWTVVTKTTFFAVGETVFAVVDFRCSSVEPRATVAGILAEVVENVATLGVSFRC